MVIQSLKYYEYCKKKRDCGDMGKFSTSHLVLIKFSLKKPTKQLSNPQHPINIDNFATSNNTVSLYLAIQNIIERPF